MKHCGTDALQARYNAYAITTHKPYYLVKSINLLVERIYMIVNPPANEPQTVRSKTHVGRQAWSYSKSFFKQLVLRKQMGLLQVEIETFSDTNSNDWDRYRWYYR